MRRQGEQAEMRKRAESKKDRHRRLLKKFQSLEFLNCKKIWQEN